MSTTPSGICPGPGRGFRDWRQTRHGALRLLPAHGRLPGAGGIDFGRPWLVWEAIPA